MKDEMKHYYLNEIKSFIHRLVLNSFFPVETEAKGDCFYHLTSISLIGTGSLSTAIRFATVAKIIEFQHELQLKLRLVLNFGNQTKPNCQSATQNEKFRPKPNQTAIF
jgi:hypothetical protein